MVDKLYHRANVHSNFRLIVCFVMEIQCFVCDCATPPIIEKLQSKGVAMHAQGFICIEPRRVCPPPPQF